MNTDLPVPPATQADTRPMTVLVVDDSVASAQALAMALEMDGYVAHVAFTGQSALAEASTHRPDCVLLDFGLDDMDGLQLAPTLRERHGADAVSTATPELLHDSGWVANRWCELLPMPLPLKQQMMELDNPLVRLELVGDMLDRTGIAPEA